MIHSAETSTSKEKDNKTILPLISVIIPIYNTEHYLSRCLDSVINNTYRNLQIICVNDGSTDRSLSILREYEKRDSRIVVIDQENQRVSATRNTGMNIAKGQWFSFIDSDDWIHKSFFQTLIDIAAESGCNLIIGGTKITSNRDEQDQSLPQIAFKEIDLQELRNHRLEYNRVWGRLINAELCRDIRFISGAEPAEDSLFNAILYKKDIRIALTDSQIYYYFTRNDSAIHSETGEALLKSANTLLKEIGNKEKGEHKELLLRSIKAFLSGRFMKSVNFGKNTVREENKEYILGVRHYICYLSVPERMLYMTLLKMPILYSIIRIAEDPTLIDFIMNRKNRRHTTKN